MYVIVRTDQGGGYLAPSGSHQSYTKDLSKAQTFTTKEAAETERCPGNEIVMSLSNIMPPSK